MAKPKLAQRVAEYLKENPGKKFSVPELAQWFYDTYRDDANEIREESINVNSTKELITQIKVCLYRQQPLLKNKGIERIEESRPKEYYFPVQTDSEAVEEMREVEEVKAVEEVKEIAQASTHPADSLNIDAPIVEQQVEPNVEPHGTQLQSRVLKGLKTLLEKIISLQKWIVQKWKGVTQTPAHPIFEQALKDFARSYVVAGKQLNLSDFQIIYLKAPHSPASLPRGKMGLYAFSYQGEWLKIGIAGPNSNARFQSQHYGLKAPSTLAKSILQDATFLIPASVDEDNIGEWMQNNCDRVNILISAEEGKIWLQSLEDFMHSRFSPRYEGRRKTS